MSVKSDKLMCPHCGARMNHHAEKVVDPINAEQAAKMDLALGGVVQEFHTCPSCGASASRMAV